MAELDLERLDKEISRLQAGPFHFSDVYGPAWDDLWIGDRVKLGNAFQRTVAKGTFGKVEDTGKKNGRGRIYVKRPAQD